MASNDQQRKPLWELEFYRQAICERYDCMIDWIWVLNKILEVPSSPETDKNYKCLKETVRKSKKCQKWKFEEKINAIECRAGSQNVLSESMKSAVKEEKKIREEEAQRVHEQLRHLHKGITKKRKERVKEWHQNEKFEAQEYEKYKDLLCTEETEVSPELRQLVNELQISVPSERPHACGFCVCCYIPKDCLQTTPLNLNDKKVVRNWKTLSENFQGSVRGRLKEDYSSLPEGIFYHKKRQSKKGKKENTSKPDEVEGIDKVAQIFMDFPKHNGNSKKSMLILTRYKYESFLKFVIRKDGGEHVTKENGDFDILVISPQIGILCGQVKAITDNSTNLIRYTCEASKQCQKDKSVFREMFRDRIDMFDIPVYEFMALPFTSRDTLKFGCKKDGKSAQNESLQCPLYNNILTKDDIKSGESFMSWLKNLSDGAVNVSDKWLMSEEQYWTLLERFVGFGSDAVMVPYSKHIGDKCFQIPLTDIQRDLVNQKGEEYRFLTLAGDYGTGKSLILVKKAINVVKEILKKGKKGKVIIIAGSDICVDGEYLDTQFPEHTVHHLQKLCKGHLENIKVETFASFTKSNFPDLSGTKGVELLKNAISGIYESGCELHLMFDEVPANFLENMQSAECQPIVEECLNLVNTLWLVIGTHSYRVWRNNHGIGRYVKDCKPHSCFKYKYLDKVLRSPENVFKVCQGISQHCEDDHQGFLRNSCLGPSPLLFRVPKCGLTCFCSSKGNREGPQNHSVESNPLKCTCMEKRLTCTLKTIFQEIGIFKDDRMVEDVNKWPGKVTMLVFGVEDDNLFLDLHALLKKCCKSISGLYLRDTIKGESKKGYGIDWAGQGNKAASPWGGLGDSFEGDEALNNSEVGIQGDLSTAVEGCQSNSFNNDEKLTSREGNTEDNQLFLASKGCPGVVSNEGPCGTGEVSIDEHHAVSVEGCSICRLDSVGSSSGDDELLGVIGKVMAENTSSSDSCSSETLLSSEVEKLGVSRDIAVDGCSSTSVVGDQFKGATGGTQEGVDYGENTRMDPDDGSAKPKILLTNATYFVGCESHVVICIDLNAMKHWFKNTKVAYSTLAVSRCLSQYIHLTWHDEEAQIMYDMNVKALSDDLGSNDKVNIENAKRQSTLESLLKDGVIQERQVNESL